jgi:hypothetical protein
LLRGLPLRAALLHDALGVAKFEPEKANPVTIVATVVNRSNDRSND